MKLSLFVATAALALTSGAASAQYPHRGHYHNAYTAPYGGYYGQYPGYRGVNWGYGNPYGGYSGSGGRVLVPHTTTHLDLVPHRGHFHVVPHTTTHFHSVPRSRYGW